MLTAVWSKEKILQGFIGLLYETILCVNNLAKGDYLQMVVMV